MKPIEEIESCKDFIDFLKKNGVTYEKLKHQVFGNTAVRVIKLIRNDTALFNNIPPQIWWSTKYAIKKTLKHG